jgi:hypothetical protein
MLGLPRQSLYVKLRRFGADSASFSAVTPVVSQARGIPNGQRILDKKFNLTGQSIKLFLRLHLITFASIGNAICAATCALNDSLFLKTGHVCVLGSVGQLLFPTHLSA